MACATLGREEAVMEVTTWDQEISRVGKAAVPMFSSVTNRQCSKHLNWRGVPCYFRVVLVTCERACSA